MRALDVERQRLNVFRMEMLGAKVPVAQEGEKTLKEAVDTLLLLTRTAGIIPAIKNSHALAEVIKRTPKLDKDKVIIVNVSRCRDKDERDSKIVIS